MDTTILITYGTRPFAQRIARQLPASLPALFASADEIPELLLNSGQYIRIPHGSSPSYAHELLASCLDNAVTCCLPLGLEEMTSVAEAKQLFMEYGITPLVPDKKQLLQMEVIRNPPKTVEFDVLANGISLLTNESLDAHADLSGVIAFDSFSKKQLICGVGG